MIGTRRLFAGAAMAAMSVGFAPMSASAQTAEQLAAFERFRTDFRDDALREGISQTTYDREMASVKFVARVIQRNDSQPEFVRPVWSYLDSAVSDRRIADGKAGISAQRTAIEAAEQRYGVDKEILAAIWGLESSYGNILGDYDILSALATLAYDGRRQKFGRQQLIGALTILDNGYASRNQLKGSWAGAMGQTQFIPTTYLAYAVDENDDGRRDLWADHEDVFASTANYLARSNYTLDEPWGFEVILPSGFNFAAANLSSKKTAGEWSALGVRAARGGLSDRADLNAQASVIVPAGANGPAFMVFDNFRSIMRYNNSTSYALGIGLLSDALADRTTSLVNDWPRDDRPLSRSERKELQQALANAGYNPGPVDGIIGSGTQAALRAWQRNNGVPADGYASAATLAALKGA